MRLHLISCLFVLVQATGFAYPSTNFFPLSNALTNDVTPPDGRKSAMTLTIDSIHHVNCLRATGYLRVVATGGTPAYTYSWSNGNTGPLATNLAPGPYDITATDDNGATATLSVTIQEDLLQPDANAGEDFTATCANSVVSLSGSGSVGANFRYLWSASNGGVIQSGGTTLLPVIKHTGTFSLQVTNIANGCTNTASVAVGATYQPPDVTAMGGTFTCSQPVTLNSTYPLPNTTFVWNGPAGYVSHSLHPQVSIVGTFVFKVTDTITTCLNNANAIVVADTVKPVAQPVGGELNCAHPSLLLSGNFSPLGVTYFWTGPGGFTSVQSNPLVSDAGTYRVTVTHPSNGCTASSTTSVTANFTPPTASATVNGSISCTVIAVQLNGNGGPAGITYSWTGPAGYTSTAQNPLVSNPGIYVLTTRNPLNGCTSSSSVNVTANTAVPGVTATGGAKTCSNPTVTLMSSSNTSGVNYRWAGPSGYTSMLQNPVVSVAGTYTVTATNPVNGCTSTASVSVTQNTTPPTLSTTTATVSCYTPTPHIIATSQTNGATFAWVGPNNYTANISNPVVTFGGTYTATALNPVNGCTTTKSIFVDENLATPSVYAGEDRALNCNFASILANPIGTSTGSNITYLWTTWDGHIASGSTILYARFDAVGNYTLTVKNTTSGCTKSDSLEVIQSPVLTVLTQQTNSVSCNGGNNGSAKATPDGGSSPYSYIWSNGGTTATINNLIAATYNVTVTDGEGCSSTGSVVVTQPGVLMANVSSTNQTQVGVNNGTATVTPTGGSAPYTYHWSNGGTSLTIINLAPGTYTVTVTDNKGCTKSNTANVNATNCNITGEVSSTNLNCAGAPTGTATANVTGATGQITYLWSNGATTKTASNLAAGNYTVTVTGANGCSTVLTAQITGPQPLLLSVVSNTSVACSGQLNGGATLNATGGIAPYTYLWSNGNSNGTVSGLGVGTYTCTTTDGHGCTVAQTTQITGPQPVVLAVASKTDVACIDGASGSITMNATGGTAPFNYTWSNNASGPTINGLTVGNYLCTVTDAHGCSKNQSAQIVTTDNVAPQLILKNASVPLSANGSASVTPAMFDNGSFDQSCNIANWTVSPTSFTCGQLGANTVTLTATDKNGNTATGTAILTVVDNIAPVMSCPGDQTASACASTVVFTTPQVQDNCVTNGTPTLVSGLPSGSNFPVGVTHEQFSFTDGGGNTATCQFTVTVSSALTVETSTLPTSCSGNCDGSATISVLGGGNPSSVIWSNGQTGLTASGLCPGSYFATLTDGSGCSQTYTVQVQVLDTQVPTLFCPNSVVVGYCNPIVTFQQPQVLDNCTVNFQQVQLVSGLPSGSSFPVGQTTEVFRYTDGGGNTGECTFSVTVHLAASVNSSSTNVGCAGLCNGTATIAVSGGQGPFGILWSNGFVGPTIANLCPGAYMATVTDADGCQQVQMAQIMQPSPMEMTFSNTTNDIGNQGNGSIMINIGGGTMPYTYAWTRNGQIFSSNQNLFGLFSGTYVVVVTDAHGCTFTSAPLVISGSVATTEPEAGFQWALYPNPAQSEVFLKMDAGTQNTRVNIFDGSGRLLLDQDVPPAGDSATRIDLSEFPEGMLLVRLTNDLGSFSKMLLVTKK